MIQVPGNMDKTICRKCGRFVEANHEYILRPDRTVQHLNCDAPAAGPVTGPIVKYVESKF